MIVTTIAYVQIYLGVSFVPVIMGSQERIATMLMTVSILHMMDPMITSLITFVKHIQVMTNVASVSIAVVLGRLVKN